jgi:hypothetical protein
MLFTYPDLTVGPTLFRLFEALLLLWLWILGFSIDPCPSIAKMRREAPEESRPGRKAGKYRKHLMSTEGAAQT